MINKLGKVSSVSFVLMLIISTFAFAYMIGSGVNIVNAAGENYYAVTVDYSWTQPAITYRFNEAKNIWEYDKRFRLGEDWQPVANMQKESWVDYPSDQKKFAASLANKDFANGVKLLPTNDADVKFEGGFGPNIPPEVPTAATTNTPEEKSSTPTTPSVTTTSSSSTPQTSKTDATSNPTTTTPQTATTTTQKNLELDYLLMSNEEIGALARNGDSKAIDIARKEGISYENNPAATTTTQTATSQIGAGVTVTASNLDEEGYGTTTYSDGTSITTTKDGTTTTTQTSQTEDNARQLEMIKLENEGYETKWINDKPYVRDPIGNVYEVINDGSLIKDDDKTIMYEGQKFSSSETSTPAKEETTAPASGLNTLAATPNLGDTTTRYDNGDGTSSYFTDNGLVTVKTDSGEIVKAPAQTPGKLPAGATVLSKEDAMKILGSDYVAGATYYQTEAGAIKNQATEEWMGRGDVKTTAFGTWNFGAAQLIDGVTWAATAAGLVQTLGGLFIKDKAVLNAATAGIAAGIMAGKAVYALLGKGGIGTEWTGVGGKGSTLMGWDTTGNWGIGISAVVGAATAWMVYNAMWSNEKVSVETVTFNCLPWQAPNGGSDCELCNDATLPCSEYRCKSLGQSCEIVNKGTKEEMCVNVNTRDSSPPVISPNNEDLSSGFEYFDIVEMPPGAGFKIRSKGTTTGCLPAYTPIQFGINTNEPSQCKIDIETKGNYSKMATYMNGDNMYKYNHTEFLNLPSSADLKNSSIKLQNGKELIFYIRCKDAAGNTNEADYALTMCVDPSPDNTAPVVQGTSIENKGCVPADAENASVEFYINEPSECKWDYYDRDYDQMINNMSCSTSAVEINAIQSYTCLTQLKGVARDGNNFYIRCKDQPGGIVNESKRNKMQESYVFNLRRSNQLKLKILMPNETVYGAVRPAPVELYAETLFGCEDNKAICYYSTTDSPNSFVQFFDTNKQDGVHTQRLDLNDGSYTYYVRCIDAGGNIVNATAQFKVSIDTNAPIVARAYEEDGYLKLVTPINSECVYNTASCDYLFSEGTQMPYANSTAHVTEWFADKKYFIKCRDQYRSEPVDCSLIVKPTENFLGA